MNFNEWMEKERRHKQSVYLDENSCNVLAYIQEAYKKGGNQKAVSISEVINAALRFTDERLKRYVEARYKGEDKKEALAMAMHKEDVHEA